MNYQADIDLPQVHPADAVAAAPTDLVTLRNWSRPSRADPHPALHIAADERVPWGTRERFSFTLRRVYQIAIVVELVRFQIAPRQAGMMAFAFTDTEECELPGQPFRRRGEVYPTGRTVLLIHGHLARVINVQDHERPYWIFGGNQLSAAAIAVDLNAVVRRVHASLHIESHEKG